MKISNLFTSTKREFLSIALLYVAISVFFLFTLIISSGDMAQGDWGIPFTGSAAVKGFTSRLFVRTFNGFGEVSVGRWCFPFFPLLNAVLGPLGFFGGFEIKVLAVFLVSFGGVAAYVLARSFRLSKSSSFLCGLFFMTTPVMFDWLMFGWIYYLIAYDMFPIMILATKKFVQTNDFRYALVNGLILSVVASQPAFILVFPVVSFVFVLFETKKLLQGLRKAVVLSVTSLSIWFLTALSFFASYSNSETFSFYHGDYFGIIQDQFRNFAVMHNPLRLWGSTYNFQFETYFVQALVIFSFLPVIVASILSLLRPKDKRVLFFLFSYLFVFLAYFVYNNLAFIVFNLPYGAIFEAPSVFLVPASLGLAMLMGYASQAIPVSSIRKKLRFSSPWLSRNLSFLIILLLIVFAGIPWWMGQASGDPLRGPTTKLNLYQAPSGFREWSNYVKGGQDYFVLYLPLDTNVRINNSTYFSQVYEGVNMGIFTEVNDLSYVSVSNSSLLLDELMSRSSEVGERWGSLSIRYIVVYTDVYSAYNMSDIVGRLSVQEGFIEVVRLPGVIVFENIYAKPVVYSASGNVDFEVIYVDPTLVKVKLNSSEPFTLVFNQIYSGGWRVWVNGSLVSDSLHFKDSNGFNRWQINAVGAMTIDIYYEPQTIYLATILVSILTIIVILLYISRTVISIKSKRLMIKIAFFQNL